jgi:NTE family protein
MLQVLTANRIRPDLIVGTSVGAVNGAWLAGGDTEPIWLRSPTSGV